MATEGHLRHQYARRVLRTTGLILNLKRQLRTTTISDVISDVRASFRRVFDDFENFDFLGSRDGTFPAKSSGVNGELQRNRVRTVSSY